MADAPGGWVPVTNSIEIEILARFAVDEHNEKEKAALVLVRAIHAYSKVVAGVEYRVILEAKDGEKANYYEAEIFEGLDHIKKLVEFKLLGPIITDLEQFHATGGLDGFVLKNSSNDDNGMSLDYLARFAVDDHNKNKDNEQLVFVDVIVGYVYPSLFSSLYHILLHAKNMAGETKTYYTVIYVFASYFKQVIVFI
uniref:Cysteine proteinase inhibitor n=1 Tax=Lotus japonicus TaxID=34305 RepID=I3S8P4_LOTJA|nr:unknown [Lotus japonicus]